MAKLLTGADEVYGDDASLAIPVAIGFFGLAAIVLLLIAVVVPMLTLPDSVTGPMTRRRSIIFKVLVVLGGVGSLVPLLLSVMALGSESDEAGWGGFVLCGSMAVTAGLVFSRLGAPAED